MSQEIDVTLLLKELVYLREKPENNSHGKSDAAAFR